MFAAICRLARRFGRMSIQLRAVTFLLATLALPPFVTSPAVAEDALIEWKGEWAIFYRNAQTGPHFAWEYSKVNQLFSARLSFFVALDGTVRGSAAANVYYLLDSYGCASRTQSDSTCVLRCRSYASWTPAGNLPVTGRLNGQTVHLKLLPLDPLPATIKSSCVGKQGTQKLEAKLSMLCAAGAETCVFPGYFLEIDLPLMDGASNTIAGGMEGIVTIKRVLCVKSGKNGFVYVTVASTHLRQEPSFDSPSNTASRVHGSRLLFKDMAEKNGTRWYYVTPPSGNPGWVPSSEVSCQPAFPLAPGKRLKEVDTGLGNAHPTSSMTTGGHG